MLHVKIALKWFLANKYIRILEQPLHSSPLKQQQIVWVTFIVFYRYSYVMLNFFNVCTHFFNLQNSKFTFDKHTENSWHKQANIHTTKKYTNPTPIIFFMAHNSRTELKTYNILLWKVVPWFNLYKTWSVMSPLKMI